MSKQQPLAFMSYVHADDKHDNGRLSEFRERLAAELRMQTGAEFPIFQDRNDILWGNNWKERVEQGLESVTFLIPILTPSYFRSHACRDEFTQFITREQALGRNDLILPLYYVEVDLFSDPEKRKQDEMATVLAERQFADWREFRFEPWTSPEVGRALAQLAKQIRDAMGRAAQEPPAAVAPARPAVVQEGSGGTHAKDSAAASTRSLAHNAPVTIVVDALHRGDYPTIGEAIAKSPAGARILVRPGYYPESIVVDKPLEIIGDGAREEIIVEVKDADVIAFQTTMGRISNLTIRQLGGDNWHAVDITQGRLEMENCDIQSLSLAAVGIRQGADPQLRRNRIHGSTLDGVLAYSGGRGTLEENEIFENTLSGVEITDADSVLRRNRIYRNEEAGIVVSETGRGLLEHNEVFENGASGIQVSDTANAIVRHNSVHDGRSGGILICDEAQATVEDNEVFRIKLAGIEIRNKGKVAARNNRIHSGLSAGVFAHAGGSGTLENNEIYENATTGVLVTAESHLTLRENRINRNSQEGIAVRAKGGVDSSGNDLRDNKGGAIKVAPGANVTQKNDVE